MRFLEPHRLEGAWALAPIALLVLMTTGPLASAHPSVTYLYGMGSDGVVRGFRVTPNDELVGVAKVRVTSADSPSVSPVPQSLAMAPSGRYLYAIQGPYLAAWRIEADGSLTVLPGTPLALTRLKGAGDILNGQALAAITISPGGGLMYIATQGRQTGGSLNAQFLYGLRVNPQTSVLSWLPGSPYYFLGRVRYLFISRAQNEIYWSYNDRLVTNHGYLSSALRLLNDGQVAVSRVDGGNIFYGNFSYNAARNIFVAVGGPDSSTVGDVRAVRVEADGGLKLTPDWTPTGGTGITYSVAMTPSGRYAYVGGQLSVHGYRVDSNLKLVSVPGHPADLCPRNCHDDATGEVNALAVSPSGKLLFAAATASIGNEAPKYGIAVMRIEPDGRLRVVSAGRMQLPVSVVDLAVTQR